MKIFALGLFISMTALLAIPSNGQDMQFGLRAGFNSANLDFDPEGDFLFDSRNGYGFGVILGSQLNQNMSIALEPTYMQKGALIESRNIVTEVELTYVDVPLMARYAFTTNGVAPYVTVGPYAAYLMRANLATEDDEHDWKDNLNSTDFGVNFGAGISYPTGGHNIFLEGRYSMGLVDINDDPDDPDTTIKNKGVQVFVGVVFPIGN